MTRLQVGDKMPDFVFQTAFEQEKQVHDYAGKKTIFWVLRYIGCPVCRLDIHEINERYSEFTEKNANVVVVIQSDPAHVQADLKNTDEQIGFDIVCDTDMHIYKSLSIDPAASMEDLRGSNTEAFMAKVTRLKELGYTHGDYEGNEQQLPAFFLLDEEGIVVQAHYAKSLTDMPSIDEVLAML